ncbi:MAG: Zn-dependent hydrolase [Chloroflexota bacterium]
MTLTINRERFLSDLDALAGIGKTADGGVTRLAFSEEDIQGRAWFRQKVHEAGLVYNEDSAGNQSAILCSSNPNAKTLLAGSHLDTVTNGGRFDGALGVLSALESLRAIKEAELDLPVHLEAISFTDEEGTMLGLFGSQAFTGQLKPDMLAYPRGGADALTTALDRLGLTPEGVMNAKRREDGLAGFVEVHVEQGTRLEEADLDIGVVTSIVGIRSLWLTFTGQAAHAGTTPMHKRRDALVGASHFVLQGRELAMRDFHPGVMTCGNILPKPGAFNIVPAEVALAVEFRHGTEDLLNTMHTALCDLAQEVANKHELQLTIHEATSCRAAPTSERVVQAIESAAESLNLSHRRMMSFAGHDTQSLTTVTPSAMLFVPSVAGISHNPRELTLPEQCVNGANTLLNTLVVLCRDIE